MFHSQRSVISIEARVSGPVAASSSSSAAGGLINLDEAVETPPSPIGPTTRAKAKASSSNSDDILTPNPKKN